MKKTYTHFLLSAVLFLCFANSKAQTALDFTQYDCVGNLHHLFDDLDSGHAVLLHFYMPNCSSCAPPALVLQAMANNVNASYPGMVTGYAFPFNNSTTCSYSTTWVFSNHLGLYVPMDSGTAMVAHYGGFGMPTVVLLGGRNHRVLYSSLNFVTTDTSAMRDTILSLLSHPTLAVSSLSASISDLSVFPNPLSDQLSVQVSLRESADISLEIIDITGRQVYTLPVEKHNTGTVSKQINTSSLPDGCYLLKLSVNGEMTTRHISIMH